MCLYEVHSLILTDARMDQNIGVRLRKTSHLRPIHLNLDLVKRFTSDRLSLKVCAPIADAFVMIERQLRSPMLQPAWSMMLLHFQVGLRYVSVVQMFPFNWTPIFEWWMAKWRSTNKHRKDTCSKNIGLRFQILFTTPHLIMNIIGMTYAFDWRDQQTCTSNNHNWIGRGPIFNMMFLEASL